MPISCPGLYAIAAVALIDFALAWAFGTGRIKPAGYASDPSYNPYARED